MAKQPDSPPDFDFTKMIADFKIPGVDIEGLISAQRKNIEALSLANKTAFEGVQTVFHRQADILRQSMEEAAAAAKEMMGAGTPQDKAIRQTEIAKATFERALTNARELSEMIVKSNTEVLDALNKRLGEALDEAKELIAKTKH